MIFQRQQNDNLIAVAEREPARTVSAVPPADAAHCAALREGAKELCRALDARRNDRVDVAQMTPEEEVLLLHVLE